MEEKFFKKAPETSEREKRGCLGGVLLGGCGGRAPNRGDGGDGGRTMLLPLRGVRTSLSLPAPQRVAKVTELLLLLLLVVMMLLLLLLQDSGTTLRVAGRGRESCTDKGRHREREGERRADGARCSG